VKSFNEGRSKSTAETIHRRIKIFLCFLHVETFTFDKLSSSSSSKKGDEAGASLDVLGAKYAY